MAKIPLPTHGYDRTALQLFGLDFEVQHVPDEGHGAPWEESDGHGRVTDWIPNTPGSDEDQMYLSADYRVLATDRHSTRYYDFAESLRIAERDKWGLSPEELQRYEDECQRRPSAEEITLRAVELDYEFLRGWCRDEWEYVGVVVRLKDTGIERSLWGIENCSTAYLAEVATELAGEIAQEGMVEMYTEIRRLKGIQAKLRKAARLYAREVARRAHA